MTEHIFTTAFVKETWGMVYTALSFAIKDPEWKLSEEEAGELTDRSMALLKTLDKKSLANIEKKYGKYVPAVSLVVCASILTGTRVKNTLAKRKAPNVPVLQEVKSGTSRSTGGATAADASRSAPPVGPVVPVEAVFSPEPASGPAAVFTGRSIRFDDSRELNLSDDG